MRQHTADAPRRYDYRDAPRYGWPFYVARRAMRRAGRALIDGADALSMREKYAVASHFRPLLPDNEALRDCLKGRRAFVIGTGPSLARQDLSPLAGEVTLALNGFLRHPQLDVVRPNYYLFADPVFFDGSDGSGRFLAEVRAKVKDATILAPYSAARSIHANGWLDASRTRFVAYAGNLRTRPPRRIDFTRTVPSVSNCAHLGIMAALYMGCSRIYLLGLDHDWLASRGHEGHFYAGKTIHDHPVAHGDKGRVGYLDHMRYATDVWLGHANLLAHARARGVEIVNCTDGGFLDVYPRQAFESVVSAISSTTAAAAA